MADVGYVWDEAKYARVRCDHGVSFPEVIDALEDERGLIELDPQGHEERWMSVGRGRSGRVLCVIYSDEDLPLTRLITAFEADSFWRSEYERRGQ